MKTSGTRVPSFHRELRRHFSRAVLGRTLLQYGSESRLEPAPRTRRLRAQRATLRRMAETNSLRGPVAKCGFRIPGGRKIVARNAGRLY